jgi:hypothetical protein
MAQKFASGPRLVARISDDGLIVAQRGMTVICDKRHPRVAMKLATLPANQKRQLRHVCAGCAYELGYRDGMEAAARGEAFDENEE